MTFPGLLAQATRAASTEQVTAAHFLVPGVATALALAAAAYLGVFRARSVDGPMRIDRRQSVWPLVFVWAFGTCAWFGGQIVFVAYRQFELIRTRGPGTPFDESMLLPIDWALLALGPPAVAFACLLVGDFIVGRGAVGWLGFGARHLPRGLVRGLVGTLIMVPCVWLVMTASQALFQAIGYEHPSEHVILKMMTESPSAVVRWSLIAGAVLAAPFFEEYLFRGHLQTIFREAFVRWTEPDPETPRAAFAPVMPVSPVTPAPAWPPGAAGGPVTAAAVPVAAPALAPPPPVVAGPSPQALFPPADPPSRVARTWAAIILTSVLFTLVHVEPWMFPPLFFLSLCLGYLYERTGNLWACVVVHMLFNATSTVVFLISRG